MMKFIMALAFSTSIAFAGETVLLEVAKSTLNKDVANVSASLSVNTKTGQVSAVLNLLKNGIACSGGGMSLPNCYAVQVPFDSISTVIPNLTVANGEITAQADGNTVVCGTVKRGKILRNKLNIRLNGNCEVDARKVGTEKGLVYQLVLDIK